MAYHFFGHGRFVAIAERDDWQTPEEMQPALDDRIRREVNAAPACSGWGAQSAIARGAGVTE